MNPFSSCICTNASKFSVSQEGKQYKIRKPPPFLTFEQKERDDRMGVCTYFRSGSQDVGLIKFYQIIVHLHDEIMYAKRTVYVALILKRTYICKLFAATYVDFAINACSCVGNWLHKTGKSKNQMIAESSNFKEKTINRIACSGTAETGVHSRQVQEARKK